MVKKPAAKKRKLLQKRTNLEWVLLTILLAIIIFLLLALLNKWWPFNSKFGNADLGTAFYTATLEEDQAALENADTADGAGGNAGAAGGTGGTGGTGSTGGSGGSGDSNNGGGSTPSSSSAILTFAAGVDTGDTKEDVSGSTSGLNESCAVLVNSSTAGKQEVCVYTEGDKVVTVTYLNDRVVSASRTGF